jgi:hypothetical protein
VPDDVSPDLTFSCRHFLAGLGAGVGAVVLGDLLPWSSSLTFANEVPAGASRFVALDRQHRLADTRQPTDGSYPFLLCESPCAVVVLRGGL